MENTRTFPTYRPTPPSSRIRPAVSSLVRGRVQDPVWVRPTFVALLGTTALLYLWNLAASGWANAYYSAAVLAGTKSWAAFFFGSLDASNFITVDKAPGALWVMEISARLFGFSAWSVLAPQALEGVATVALVYLAVRRWYGPAAGLLAGAVVALTPVAGLMFRFNNPDALLVLLITAATYATVRAIENGRTRWLVLAGALVGAGFLAKELQAFIIIPVLGGVYLFAGPPALGRRIGQVLAAAVAVIVSSGWWIAAVELIPSASRPYIGGSQNNDLISLIFGYNGFGRLTGNESGRIGDFGALGSRWGLTGGNRLFNAQFCGLASVLIPRGGLLLWPSVLVAGLAAAALLIASLSKVSRNTALAIAAMGVVAVLAGPAAYTFDTVTTAHTGAIPSAGPAVATAGGPGGGLPGGAGGGRFGAPGGALGGGFRGAFPGGGPNSALGGGGNPGANPGGGAGFLESSQPAADLVSLLQANASRYTWVAATTRANSAAGYELATGDPVMAIGGFNGTDPAPTLAQFQQYVPDREVHHFLRGGGGPGTAGTQR